MMNLVQVSSVQFGVVNTALRLTRDRDPHRLHSALRASRLLPYRHCALPLVTKKLIMLPLQYTAKPVCTKYTGLYPVKEILGPNRA